MADETIIADEQNVIDVSNESDVDDSNDESTDVEVDANDWKDREAEAKKWENRYKSTKKKESVKPAQAKKVVSNGADLNSVVEQKIAEFTEREAFKRTHWEEIFSDVIKIKEQHPTLTLEQAMKFSPIANDPARTANTDEYSSPWRANLNADKVKTISSEALSKLPQNEYNIISDKISSWEIKIKD